MAISREDVLKVAHLARINLSEEEVNLFSGQLEDILEYIDKLKELDTSNIKPTSHVFDIQNVLRKDTPKQSLSKEDALKNSPLSLRGHFQVPKVIE